MGYIDVLHYLAMHSIGIISFQKNATFLRVDVPTTITGFYITNNF